ncbi:histidine kinase [Siphonobacter sp. SORGH_AS_0500]|uniref:sensor histidine kinase n=1 Tax=Siphonobacter sp. SORGH_AS_0500 TaxID=1864824 RepID=UPI000CB3DE39|nr:histidine kinase [Siphonobacter sp. SORGH_AS_0500]PKK35098.1 histidine kinase [Siphonobacter sp. SORGH_AS_0500]
MDKNERNLCWYSALFITLVINSARLLALRENGIMARYWQFNVAEYSFQFLFNYGFCIVLFTLNLGNREFLAGYRKRGQLGLYYFFNALVVIFLIGLGSISQRILFPNAHLHGLVLKGYITRFLLSTILVAISVRLLLLIRESQKKDYANAQLKEAYYQAQLALLKGQLDPHFLFNSLSTLSGIVREDPVLAQSYILHLSKVYRNTITNTETALVRVSDELTIIHSYAQLIYMRLEEAFCLQIEVSLEAQNAWLPHLSLQPLLENVAKHNIATRKKPLVVTFCDEDGWLIIRNNHQPLINAGYSTGTGLVNLNERFRLLTEREIEIERTNEWFIVRLPLLKGARSLAKEK